MKKQEHTAGSLSMPAKGPATFLTRAKISVQWKAMRVVDLTGLQKILSSSIM